MRIQSGYLAVLAAGVAGAGLVAVLAAVDQGKPAYIARLESKVYHTRAGQPETLWETQTITQARDREGRLYNASESPSAGLIVTLRDTVNGHTYRIDHKNRKVLLVGMQDFGDARPPLSDEQKRELGSRRSEASGIPCVRTDTLMPAGAGAETKKIGESCRSWELGLEVWSESRVPLPGFEARVSTRLVEIRMGAQPPAGWFRVPAEYSFEDAKRNR